MSGCGCNLIGRIKDLMRAYSIPIEETQRLLAPTFLVYDSQITRLAALIGYGRASDPSRGRTSSADSRSAGRTGRCKGFSSRPRTPPIPWRRLRSASRSSVC